MSGYASSKGALTALTKSYAAEMSNYGIRANTISPGFIKTSFFKKFKTKKKTYINGPYLEYLRKVEEIAELICFVLSDEVIFKWREYINRWRLDKCIKLWG